MHERVYIALYELFQNAIVGFTLFLAHKLPLCMCKECTLQLLFVSVMGYKY